MNLPNRTLNILLVDDDEGYLDVLSEFVTDALRRRGYEVLWDRTPSFEQAQQLSRARYYDLILCDVYVGGPDDTLGERTVGAVSVIDELRGRRFCGIVYFSSASKPAVLESLLPFERFVDKTRSRDVIGAIEELLETGIPQVAADLYEELGQYAGSYLWGLFGERWEELAKTGATSPEVLRRLVRRRAATQLARVSTEGTEPRELEDVHGCEYYTYPPIPSDAHRLGEVLRHRGDRTFRVILTPHCLLAIQRGSAQPKVSSILTIGTRSAEDVLAECACKTEGQLRQLLQSPARTCKPEGRYWVLPAFLDIPDLFCDFLDVATIPIADLDAEFEQIASLEAPLSEALQSCFLAFHLPVGLPNLVPGSMLTLVQGKETQ